MDKEAEKCFLKSKKLYVQLEQNISASKFPPQGFPCNKISHFPTRCGKSGHCNFNCFSATIHSTTTSHLDKSDNFPQFPRPKFFPKGFSTLQQNFSFPARCGKSGNDNFLTASVLQRMRSTTSTPIIFFFLKTQGQQ